jgi:hypothetical protein
LAGEVESVAVTVYPVMGDPSSEGAVQDTAALASPAVADTPEGASGTVVGVTGEDAGEGGPVPTRFLAVTANVYESPLVRPPTVRGLADPVVVSSPWAGVVRSEAVTVYPVMADPPSVTGAIQVTIAWWLPAVAEGLVGEPGRVAGVTAGEGADGGPSPIALVADTVKVYAVPLIRPVSVCTVPGAVKATVGWAVPPMIGVTT